MSIETIHDIANKAVTDPDHLLTQEAVRLGAWILDHTEHVRAHHESVELQREMDQPGGPSPLVRRMMPSPGDAPKLTADAAAEPVADLAAEPQEA